ncbi:MAG TPA: class I SAM-dependent methyltransferase [Gemmatimonadota bacterium]|nr:class I SAM-dependent methyltransferase [Gemmatimonadota bacterium]
MEPEEYGRMHRLERDHWWFRGKRAAIAALLQRAGATPPGPRDLVVDVGCGTGAILERFGTGALAVGIDDHDDALRYARGKTGALLARSDARALPLRTASVDRIFLLDVAEHVPEDTAVFAEIRRVLKSNGLAVVHVPAHPRMWSPHDVAMHHVRRYTRAELEARFSEAGLSPVLLTYTFGALLLPAVAVRAWKRRGEHAAEERADFGVAPGWMNRILAGWQATEAAWLARANLPLGVSLAAVLRPER